MTPGIYDWTHDEYHADSFSPGPSLAAGIADALINQTPLHAFTRHRRLNPAYVEESDSKFDPGTAAHALLLEGIDKMAVLPFDDWRTKAAKEQRDLARAEGKVPLLTHQANKVQRMVEAAKKAWEANTDLAGYSLATGLNEKSLLWWEDVNPMGTEKTWLRCRPDYLSPDRKLIVDAKFTDTDAAPAQFANQICRMAYDLRGAFYLRGNAALGGHPDAKYVFLVQEAKAPFATSFIGLPPAYVAMGQEKVEAAIAIWRECMRTGKWPGYPARIFYPDPPPWAMAQWEEKRMDAGDTGLIPGTGTWEPNPDGIQP